MKPYDCNYTWKEVKEAINTLLLLIEPDHAGDIVYDMYDDELPRAIDNIARYTFMFGDDVFVIGGVESELKLVKLAYFQLNKVGYIGKKE